MTTEPICIAPPDVHPPVGNYSHGLLASGPFLFVAGQVGLDEHGALIGPGDVAAQTRQALTNLRRIIEAAGGTLTDVVRTTVYLTDLAHLEDYSTVHRKFFPTSPPPNTLLIVSSLASPDHLIEVDAIVRVPEPSIGAEARRS